MDLPLFPLKTVLFPGARLPLHIFEPRYRQMIGECVEREAPFGVVLIRSGAEVGGGAVPHRVGATARITAVERLPDGRMNIVTVGQQRFRILETTTERPYLMGTVELLWDVDADTGEAFAAAERVRGRFEEFFRLMLALRGEWVRRVETPSTPGRLADFIGGRLPVGTDAQQALLEELSVPNRLQVVDGLLDALSEMLERRVAAARPQRYRRFGAA